MLHFSSLSNKNNIVFPLKNVFSILKELGNIQTYLIFEAKFPPFSPKWLFSTHNVESPQNLLAKYTTKKHKPKFSRG